MNMLRKDKVQIISEIGINHNGSLKRAKEMIRVSADCGADIAKFQFLKTSEMYTTKAGKYRNESGIYNIYDVVEKNEMGPHWVPELMAECKQHNIRFLCSIYDLIGLEELLEHDVQWVKIASYEIHFLQLFERLGRLKIPIIFSCAASSLGDVEDALEAYGNPQNACIMHCNGKYPTEPSIVNLNVLKTFKLAFPDCIHGFSDHTVDPVAAPIVATMLGARILEKHFTLDKSLPGPDHSFAVNPKGLAKLVNAVRETEDKIINNKKVEYDPVLLGNTAKTIDPKENYIRKFAFRCIYARDNITKGDLFTPENIGIFRSGQQENGLHPREFSKLLGQRCPVNLPIGEPITLQRLLDDH